MHTAEDKDSISNMEQLRNSVINTFYVVLVFLVCFVPYCCLGIFINSTRNWSRTVMLLNLPATSLVFLNSALNQEP